MAKTSTKTKDEKRSITSREPVQQNCSACKAEYTAFHVVYSDGHENISPPRCEICQTRHLTNVRMSKTLKDLDLLKNLKLRLSDKQKAVLVATLQQKADEVVDVIMSAQTKKTGPSFDIGVPED